MVERTIGNSSNNLGKACLQQFFLGANAARLRFVLLRAGFDVGTILDRAGLSFFDKLESTQFFLRVLSRQVVPGNDIFAKGRKAGRHGHNLVRFRRRKSDVDFISRQTLHCLYDSMQWTPDHTLERHHDGECDDRQTSCKNENDFPDGRRRRGIHASLTPDSGEFSDAHLIRSCPEQDRNSHCKQSVGRACGQLAVEPRRHKVICRCRIRFRCEDACNFFPVGMRHP
ncbi:hypothetical protein N9W17_05070 [Jannaschia sp.]|nr:hypothetical protein [Jannaschia sp.]